MVHQHGSRQCLDGQVDFGSEFDQYGGTDFVSSTSEAQSADGSRLSVMGHGKVTFALWGRVFKNIPVKIMTHLPSGVLLSNKFVVAAGPRPAPQGRPRHRLGFIHPSHCFERYALLWGSNPTIGQGGGSGGVGGCDRRRH